MTPYNGQKELLTDVALKRCSWNPIFGMPCVEVLTDYPPKQHQIVLLSMVRTQSPGLMADVSHYATAMTAASHGLYVFGRYEIYETVESISQGIKMLGKTSTKGLEICEGETFTNCTRQVTDKVKKPLVFGDCISFGKYVNELAISKIGKH